MGDRFQIEREWTLKGFEKDISQGAVKAKKMFDRKSEPRELEHG